MRVLTSFWSNYQTPGVQAVFADARALGNPHYVLGGLSAGAAISQYGALDLNGVRGVYLFGECLRNKQHVQSCWRFVRLATWCLGRGL